MPTPVTIVALMTFVLASQSVAVYADGPAEQLADAVAVDDDAIRQWQYVVVHHSATEQGSVEGIDRVHKARVDSEGRPWRGIGYHFVIGNGQGMADGQVTATFRWKDQLAGAHAGQKLYNEYGIGICLIGNFESAPPTSRQRAALASLIAELKRVHAIDPAHIVAHGDIKQTACPGKLFPRQQFLTAQIHTTRKPTLDAVPSAEPSCDDGLMTADHSSSWKESR